MSDHQTEKQLLNGFYTVENGQWRWVAAKFSVSLRPPRNSEQTGAVLKVDLNVPEAVISNLKGTTLSATIGGVPLEPETYSQAGDHTYTRQVTAGTLRGDFVRVDFSLSKAIAPGKLGDVRELGIIIKSIALN